MSTFTRREATKGAAAIGITLLASKAGAAEGSLDMPVDLILRNGRLTTLDRSRPSASAIAIRDGLIDAVGEDQDVMRLAGPGTGIITLSGQPVLSTVRSSTLRVMWPRSANSHTGQQPRAAATGRTDGSIRLRAKPPKTACTFRGVHRWKADLQQLNLLPCGYFES